MDTVLGAEQLVHAVVRHNTLNLGHCAETATLAAPTREIKGMLAPSIIEVGVLRYSR